jgi:hypothetical protein
MGSALFAQVQFVDQFFITIGFCFAQIIEQTPAMRDHLKQAAPRRMIFSVGLKVFSQMLDPAGEKCDLHIRAAGIFLMQLELLKTRRLVALCHNEGANLDEEPALANASTGRSISLLTKILRCFAPFSKHHSAIVQSYWPKKIGIIRG